MKSRTAAILLLMTLAVIGSPRAQEIDTKGARTSADTWLALIDKESYAASWDAAATGFRSRITSEQWQAAVRGVRGPLGEVKSRTLKSATPATTLPGAPDGEYVVFQFNTSFAEKAAGLETVTTVREKDGTWRVAGYSIK